VSAKNFTRTFLLTVSILGGMLVFSGCATTVPAPRPDLTPAEFFQYAQDASDSGDYRLSISYYEMFRTQYPQDSSHQAWAMYEIAFLYHKMGEDKKAIALFDELIALYANNAGLPDGPRILAEKVKADIQSKTAPQA
jgi:outer membrane protein assembly factor BamD (BamD/ComL family)